MPKYILDESTPSPGEHQEESSFQPKLINQILSCPILSQEKKATEASGQEGKTEGESGDQCKENMPESLEDGMQVAQGQAVTSDDL